MKLINLPFIASQAIKNEQENIAFRQFLKCQNGDIVDEVLAPIAQKYTTQINCTQCGNCCKNIMITADITEVTTIANKLQIPLSQCKTQYFEASSQSDTLMINAVPCHFLTNNTCSIYTSRPSACASFPHLHLSGFTRRLFSMLSGYGICPQIYHSIEALKQHFSFVYKA